MLLTKLFYFISTYFMIGMPLLILIGVPLVTAIYLLETKIIWDTYENFKKKIKSIIYGNLLYNT